jgi:hypothetical protein
MPVERFRSFDEASRALVGARRDRSLPARVAALWALSARLAPPLNFRGIRKYRTLEAADADRRAMTMARARRP